MKLNLVDINPMVVEAWRSVFCDFPEVSVLEGDILSVANNTIVSPANSYGFMDGGIDAAYLKFFGYQLQSVVQDSIARRPAGILPVGACEVVPTGSERIPYLVVAPTMETPEAVPQVHAYRAFRAVLREVGDDPVLGKNIFCPGLTTLVGRVHPQDAAEEMGRAYGDWKRNGVS